MATTTEFDASTKLYDAYTVAIFFAKEGDGTELFRFVHRQVAVILQCYVFADAAVDKAFHLAQFFACHLLEVAEVEAQIVGSDERTLLFDVCTEHLAQRLVEQVCRGVVRFATAASLDVYLCLERCAGICWQLACEVDRQIVFALSVEDFYLFSIVDQEAGVAYLTTHFGVEGCGVEHQFVVCLFLLLYAAIAQDAAFAFGVVPTDELCFAFAQYYPVISFHSCGIAGTFLLLLHICIELFLVDSHAVLCTDELGQVEGETIGVEQSEGFATVYFGLACCLGFADDAVEQVDTCGEGAEEGFFFFLHHT